MRYCVIGQKLPHTMSPEIHRAFGNENYGVRELADVTELRAFVESGEYDGFNVTVPYKTAILDMLDRLDESAACVGAVNTVVAENGGYAGYNTDVGGMIFALKRAGINISGERVMILGGGGTSRTARRVCALSGAEEVVVVSRAGAINYENCYEYSKTNVIINTTPVGMLPNAYASPVELEPFCELKGVFDAVYNPLSTMLTLNARRMGIKADNGLGMLTEQARLANNLFVGISGEGAPADEEAGRQVLAELYSKKRNVVLTGMAGSGKTSIGRFLAKTLEREFVDTDAEIERKTGRSVSSIITESGEAAFRTLEKAAVKEACSDFGRVIALGGGAALDIENRFYAKSNGTVILIARAPEELATEGRPLSSDLKSAARLWREREPIYRSFADFAVNNNKAPREAADEILKTLYTL